MRSAGRSGQLTHAHTGGFSRVHLTGSGPNACCGNVHGAAGISLETTQDNAAARALYRAAGWNEDATQWYSLPLSRSH